MTVRRLAAVDAQSYWLSAKIPNDPLLVYGFDGVPADLEQAIEVIRGRAEGCAEFRLRIRDGSTLTYPSWASVDVDAGQFTVHQLDDNSWAGCLAAVGGLADDQLDRTGACVAAARLHPCARGTRRRGTGNGRGRADLAWLRRRGEVIGDGGAAVRRTVDISAA